MNRKKRAQDIREIRKLFKILINENVKEKAIVKARKEKIKLVYENAKVIK